MRQDGHHAHLPGCVVSNTVDYRGDAPGLGDATLLGQYRFINSVATRTEAAFLFGVKLPTGATNRIDAQGLLFETEFQPGSGSTDLLLGAAFTQRFGAWSFDANLLGTITVAARRTPSSAAASSTTVRCPTGWSAPRPALSTPRSRRPRCRTGRCRTATPIRSRRSPPRRPGPSTRCSSSTASGTARMRPPTCSIQTPAATFCCSRLDCACLTPVSRVRVVRRPIVNQMNGLQSKTEYRVLTGVSYAF